MRTLIYRARHLVAIRLERHRLGKAQDDELGEVLSALGG